MHADNNDPAQTLKSLRPRLSTRGWVVRFVFGLAVVGVLLWAWRDSEINPVRMWEKRGNAWTYLFGETPDADERDAIQRRAERQLRVELQFDARDEIIAEREAAGLPELSEAALQEAAAERAADELAETPPTVRALRVAEHYDDLADEARGGYFPPVLEPDRLQDYTEKLLETVAIAIWGSIFAVLLALPASLLAADRTLRLLAPGDGYVHRAIRWFAIMVVRRLFDACRGFNEYVLALIFVAMIGLGPFAGVMALFIHTFGILGKVFSEAIETADQGQIEGIAATGAGSSQIISFAVLPQIMPYVVSQSLLRFESNVRSATILGFVGAGGIGFLLAAKLQSYAYREVCTMMIMIIIVVSIIDLFCSRLMRRFI
jgi:phosphonate transport system permease protein